MGHTLTINVPDAVYLRLERTAARFGRSVQELALANLAGLPLSFDADLPEPHRSELAGMAAWSNEALMHALREVMGSHRQRRYTALLRRARVQQLNESERAALDALRDEADRIMLRKAHAAALLRSRGEPVPEPRELPSPR